MSRDSEHIWLFKKAASVPEQWSESSCPTVDLDHFDSFFSIGIRLTRDILNQLWRRVALRDRHRQASTVAMPGHEVASHVTCDYWWHAGHVSTGVVRASTVTVGAGPGSRSDPDLIQIISHLVRQLLLSE